MDIDFFKPVNDTYGHDIGDEVLKEFASRITANVRGIDLACRYGGEEFVVAMPDTDMAFAYNIAERLRQSIETTPVRISRAPGSSTSPSPSASPGWKARATPPRRCCIAPIRRCIAPSAQAATKSSPTLPKPLPLVPEFVARAHVRKVALRSRPAQVQNHRVRSAWLFRIFVARGQAGPSRLHLRHPVDHRQPAFPARARPTPPACCRRSWPARR